MARYDLSEAEWRLVEPLRPPVGKGKRREDDRRIVNGIFYVLRTGSPWRDLPERYGPYTPVYNRFNRWAKKGVWLRMFETLAERSPQSLQLIDSSIVRAHQHAAGGKRGSGSRHWPFSWRTEHQAPRRRRPGRFARAPAHHARASFRQNRLPRADRRPGRPSIVVADRGYDSRALVELVASRGGQAHIPTQSKVKLQRSVDRELYRRRNLVERYFCNLKQFRRIATRFEKTARNFLAAVALASARLWLRAIESTP